MNRPPMPAAASPTGAAGPRDARLASGAETPDDAVSLFVALLGEATASAAVPSPAATAAGPRPDDQAPPDPPAVDWAFPFIPPAPNTPPPPIDLELPAPGDADAASVTTGSNPAGPAVLATKVGTATETGSSLVGPAAGSDHAVAVAGLEAPAQVATRVESAGPGAATHAVVRTVHAPVGDSRWPEQVGHEVRILVERGVQSATLRVSPEHLGPVEVRIDIVGDKANVLFAASHADTRSALADAIPRLREMLAGSGLALGDTGVRQDTHGAFRDGGPRPPATGTGGDLAADEATTVTLAHARLGLVDAYA